MLEAWQHFYAWHDPAIFTIGSFSLRWYGLMYVTALLTGYFWGRRMVARGDWQGMNAANYENLFLFFVIGAVLGARLGYVLFYATDTGYLLAHPWQIFNPVQGGSFVGISGLSYHGAIAGVIAALAIFAYRYKMKVWFVLDIAAVSGSAGYLFGRIGNFLNAELVGRETTVWWGVFVGETLRHPSALYEAFLEGFLVFAILWLVYKRRSFVGQMALLYAMLYTAARFIAEFWRQPDPQVGFVAFGAITMGQLLSTAMFSAALLTYLYLRSNRAKR
ncbi:prolipoprotein diacylglyceryl transferase [Campylobacterota bacterium]|nr:prolipoprotein diacylglyceryl transferase [Campylobacterota bacterium]